MYEFKMFAAIAPWNLQLSPVASRIDLPIRRKVIRSSAERYASWFRHGTRHQLRKNGHHSRVEADAGSRSRSAWPSCLQSGACGLGEAPVGLLASRERGTIFSVRNENGFPAKPDSAREAVSAGAGGHTGGRDAAVRAVAGGDAGDRRQCAAPVGDSAVLGVTGCLAAPDSDSGGVSSPLAPGTLAGPSISRTRKEGAVSLHGTGVCACAVAGTAARPTAVAQTVMADWITRATA